MNQIQIHSTPQSEQKQIQMKNQEFAQELAKQQ